MTYAAKGKQENRKLWMKRQAEGPNGSRDRSVGKLSTASGDCAWYLGRRPELGCPLLRCDVFNT